MVKIMAVVAAFTVVLAKDCKKSQAVSRKYAQCGGYTYHGETCCPEDRRCEFKTAEYSQCSGNFTGGAKAYEQCGGGPDYTGPTFCAKHLKCVKSGPYYSGCQPKKALTTTKTCKKSEAVSRKYAQCGGYTYHGETCCPKGRGCAFVNAEYSQCKECAQAGGQCAGGLGYNGSTCCSKGFECRSWACQPKKALTITKTCKKSETVSRWYAQCGGYHYHGETCCPKTLGCAFVNAEYSQCKACAQAYGQCAGGPGYNGSTCCSKGFECVSSGPYYSGCQPKKALTITKTCKKSEAVSRKYAQCGGYTYHGETCCPKGRGCAFVSAEYSQCKECAQAYGQCAGGPGYNGSTCCSKGFECVSSGAYYSGCQPKLQSKTVLV